MNYNALTAFYFTDLLSLVCNLLAFISSLKSLHNRKLRYIRVYIQIAMAFNLLLYCSDVFIRQSHWLSVFEGIVVTLYTIAESFLILMFFSSNSESTKLKRQLFFIYITFIIFLIIILALRPRSLIDPISALAAAESFAIMLFSFFSLQAKLKKNSISEFVKSAEFYVFAAVIGYFSFSIPNFLGIMILGKIDKSLASLCDSINLILCSAFFLTIRKGFHAVPQN